MADDRVSIIKRIYQDNDKESDTWVDIERISKMTVTAPNADGYGLQQIHYSFDWDQFDTDVERANGIDTDSIEFKKIADPNDAGDPNDPANAGNTIKIPIRLKINLEGANNNSSHLFFSNGKDNGTRKVHTKRVYHYDISHDILDPDGQPPKDADIYSNLIQDASDTKDEDQYIEVEIIDKFVLEQNRGHTYSEKNWSQDINSILSEGL